MQMRDNAEDKTEFNRRAKESMREFLQSKSSVEKVESIERMNVVDRIAKKAMREALAGQTVPHASPGKAGEGHQGAEKP